jgi:hypothetical protein
MLWWLAMWICVGGAVVCALAALHLERVFSTLRKASQLSLAELKTACAASGDTFDQFVCVSGWVRCDTPLIAELSGTPCVAYNAEVIEHGESIRSGWQSRHRLLDQAPTINFYLEDPTDCVQVSPANAEIQSLETMNIEHPYGKHPQTYGQILLHANKQPNRKVHKYQYREKLLPLNHWVTVIGEAHTHLGELMITAPLQSDRLFLITHRPLSEVMTEKRLRRNTALYSTLLFLILAALMFTFLWPPPS